MAKHISAKAKNNDPIDNKRWREWALRPDFKGQSKAEKHFDKLLDSSSKAYKTGSRIDRKDYDIVTGLLDRYWELQDEILDEENSDAQTQISLINQQNDIKDELERVYEKYLPNEKKENTRN